MPTVGKMGINRSPLPLLVGVYTDATTGGNWHSSLAKLNIPLPHGSADPLAGHPLEEFLHVYPSGATPENVHSSPVL